MEKIIEGYKFDRLKSRLPLVVAVFLLSYPLSFIVDKEYTIWMLSGRMTLTECLTDFGLTLLSSFLFVEISVFYCRLLLRFMPFSRNPYRSLFIYAVLLLVLNNLTAVAFSWLTDMVYNTEVSFFHEMMYMVSAIVTFISYVYTNARYMEAIIDSENQKKKLEINLLKESERTTQMQLEVLKAQIDPHFMFNNFSILSELIVEDRTLAERFLENLSSVYRYVIQNLKRDTVPISEELAFLRSYIYLIGMRYEDAIRIDVDERLEQACGQVPPVSFQLLVENAIKHNQLSVRQPLHISILKEENYIVIKNDLRPVASELSSTDIGQRNIAERYFLLCKEKPIIEKSEHTYTVKLPIIPNEYEHPDYRR